MMWGPSCASSKRQQSQHPIVPGTTTSCHDWLKVEDLFRIRQSLSRTGNFRELCLINTRVSEIKTCQSVDDGCCNHDPRKPFVVGRYDVPGILLARGLADHFFVSSLVLIPEPALGHVGSGKPPVLIRRVSTLQEASFLLVFGKIQKELHPLLEPALRVLLTILITTFGAARETSICFPSFPIPRKVWSSIARLQLPAIPAEARPPARIPTTDAKSEREISMGWSSA